VLAERLTVAETYFLRNTDQFRAFAEVALPERIHARSDSRQLRILSAGCASGEETYSLAIAMRDRLPELASWDVTLMGVDINPTMIERAVKARYAAWSLRATPPDLRERYFRSYGREFILCDIIRRAASFAERNLVAEDPVFWRRGIYDVIFCRNVIMYFAPEVIRAVVARMAQALAPGGFLFLGHAETLRGISLEFNLCHTHETFYYQRRSAAENTPGPAGWMLPSPSVAPTAHLLAVAKATASWVDMINRASERIADLARYPGKRLETLTSREETQSTRSQSTPRTWDLGLVVELLRQERFADALGLISALPPDSMVDPDAQLLRAVLLTNCGDLVKAEQVCAQLLAIDDLNAGAHYLTALCREHAGDRRAAAEHDQAAIHLDAAFAMPHLHLGLMAQREGDEPLARRELEQALTLLVREDASRILLFGGGFSREALIELCRTYPLGGAR